MLNILQIAHLPCLQRRQGDNLEIERMNSHFPPRACQPEQGALAAHRELRVTAVEQGSPVRRAHLPDLRGKKSRSTISSPNLACGVRSSVPPDLAGPASEYPFRMFQQLLLAGVDLRRMDLMAHRQPGDLGLFPQCFEGDLPLKTASILRPVLLRSLRLHRRSRRGL